MHPPITSLQNPKIKEVVRLRSGSSRRGSGRVIIDGLREFTQAILADVNVQSIFLSEHSSSLSDILGPQLGSHWEELDRKKEGANAASLSSVLRKLEQIVIPVSDTVFEKLAFGQRDSQIVAIIEEPDLSIANFRCRKTYPSQVVLVIDQVEKPGNVGAMLRTSDAAGVDGVILCDPISDPWNANSIRSSLGAIFRLPLACGSFSEVIPWLKANHFKILAARVDGSSDYREQDWSGKGSPDPRERSLNVSLGSSTTKASGFPVKSEPVEMLGAGSTSKVDIGAANNFNACENIAIVVGSEANGLGPQWSIPEVSAVRLPMRGAIDSLNVSVTAAVLMYEATRSRM